MTSLALGLALTAAAPCPRQSGAVITASPAPIILPVRAGDTLTDSLPETAMDTESYASSEGRITAVQAEWSINGGAWIATGLLAVIKGDEIRARVTVADDRGNEVVFYTGATIVQAPPVYYVDSANGSDGNDGLSETAALASLGAIPPADGVQIRLMAGSEWREGLDWGAHDNVTVEGYGDLEGAGFPVIRGDAVLDTSWEDAAARNDAYNSVYSRTINADLGNDTRICPLVWEDGMRLDWAADLATCQATPGSWYAPEPDIYGIAATDMVTIHVHPTGSTDPRSDGKTYEAVARAAGIVLGDGATVRHLHVMRAGSRYGNLAAGLDARFEGVVGEESLRHIALMGSGTMRKCVALLQKSDPRTGHIGLEFYRLSGLPAGSEATFEACVGHLADPANGGFSMIGGHTSDGSRYAHVSLTDCAVKNGKVGGNDVIDYSVTRTYVENGAIQPAASGTVTLTDPCIRLLRPTETDHFELSTPAAGWSIEGLRAYVDSDMTGRDFIARTAEVPLAIRRSVVKLTPNAVLDGSSHYVIGDTAAAPLTLDGVVLDTEAAGVIGRTYVTEQAAHAITARNNVYWNDSGVRIRLDGGAIAYSHAEWLTAEQPGNEAGSVATDPLLADPAGGDFTAGASGIPTESGLERPDIAYTPILETAAEAQAWIVSGATLPENIAAPAISGGTEIGATLSCDPGIWTGTPDPALSCQWTCDGLPIPGETGESYTIAAADAGLPLACEVTATNAAGPVTIASNAVLAEDPVPETLTITDPGDGTLEVTATAEGDIEITVSGMPCYDGTYTVDPAALDAGPVCLVPATVAGTGSPGETLTKTSSGLWAYAGDGFAVSQNWQADGADISGETGDSYTLTAAEAGTTVALRETAADSTGSRSEGSNGIAVAASSYVFIDDFSGYAEGDDIPTVSSDWERITGYNNATMTADGAGIAEFGYGPGLDQKVTVRHTGALANDQYARATLNVISDPLYGFSGPGVRLTYNSTAMVDGYYLIHYTHVADGIEELRLVSIVTSVTGETAVVLDSTPHTVTPGDMLEIRASGTTITGYLNGSAVLSATDADHAAGDAGMVCSFRAGVYGHADFDDFECGDL